MQLLKTDIKAYFKFSDNVSDIDIRNAISDALEFDVLPVLGSVRASLMALPTGRVYLATADAWTTSQYYIDSAAKKVYKVLEDTANLPGAEPAAWEYAKDDTLSQFYVKPYWAAEAYRRYFMWAGTNIAQSGAVKHYGSDFQHITPTERAELSSDIRAKRDTYLNRLLSQLKVDYNIGTDTCYPNRAAGRGGVKTYAI